MREVAILGSTGSIGRQTLEVIDEHPEEFKVKILTAQNNYALLIQQALKYLPRAVVIENEEHYRITKSALAGTKVEVFSGTSVQTDIINFLRYSSDIDVCDIAVIALAGAAGLQPTMRAVSRSLPVALANKEALVVGGSLIMSEAEKRHTTIMPIDSEHSAIYQCLAGEESNSLEKIILTGSGGPFRGRKISELQNVRVEDALKHPTWSMGKKITIDSATLMNKGLEMIEAAHLFSVS
ncbi:MAG: 1-deoxy-D-xylulose-5-phosphate reductoisomerase, partial [Bacteroidales bacterium]|nr:1-deoxy-D-xylulose-5-phosphate reductoisomerase [Bacteroidales bacterium]